MAELNDIPLHCVECGEEYIEDGQQYCTYCGGEMSEEPDEHFPLDD